MNSGDPRLTSAFIVICTDVTKHPNQISVLANWLSIVFSVINVAHKMYVNTITCSIYTWNFAVCYVSLLLSLILFNSVKWCIQNQHWSRPHVLFISSSFLFLHHFICMYSFFVGFLPFPIVQLFLLYSTFHALFKRTENGTDTLKGSR